MAYRVVASNKEPNHIEIYGERECRTYVRAEKVAFEMWQNEKNIREIDITANGKDLDEAGSCHTREGASMTSVNWVDEFEAGYRP